MHTKIHSHNFDHLMSLAEDCARWQLQQKAAFQNVFFFVADSRIGCAWADRDESPDPFPNFIEAMRHLAISINVTEGVLIERLKRVSVPSPEECPASPAPSATEYVLMVWQSRNSDHTFAFPVHRKADGAFSHFGQFLRANPLSWVANIIPKQEPDEADRATSMIMLQKI